MKIDLHVHTSASDGDFSLEQLLKRADSEGISVIAITDHDTARYSYCPELEALANEYKGKMDVVSGVEISCRYENAEVHIIGYFSNVNASNLKNIEVVLEKSRIGRKFKMQAMVSSLQSAGYDISMSDVLSQASDSGFYNTSHLIRALLAKKQFYDFDSADKEIKSNHDSPYPSEYVMSPEAAISLIKQNKGVAVLAHPVLLEKKLDTRAFIAGLVNYGLDGVEAYSSKQDYACITTYLDICDEYDLIATAGSDYHGTITCPKRKLGSVSKDNSDSNGGYNAMAIVSALKQRMNYQRECIGCCK